MSNRIVEENAKLDGRTDRAYWDAAISNQIEGFTTDFSVNAGQTVSFKINVNGTAADDLPYKIEIYRLGYYGGSGAREVAELINADGTVQPEALFNESLGLVDAGNWFVTDQWNVPADAVSGVYLARVQRLDADGNPIEGATNQIPFIVRNDGIGADVVLQTSDTTWHAYNGWAGNNGKVGPNFYGDPANMVDHDPVANPGLGAQDRAYAVSYNRPFLTRDGGGAAAGAQDYLFGADYAALFWLEKNGYDVSYMSGVDTDRLGPEYLQNYKAFISVGHDEYWSGEQRANVEDARDAGVNILFWSGNEVYWKTRWETSISEDGTEYRTLVCYKETWANGDPNAGPEDYANIDPTNIWTGTWRDVRFLQAKDADGNFIAGGSDPDPISGLYPQCHCAETTLTGQLFGPDGTGQFGGALDVPTDYGTLRYWRNTAATDGELDIAPGLIGYEWDVTPDDENRPEGLIKLSSTTLPWNGILVDQGNRVEPGTATHNLTMYRAESGALVFASGTVFWSWALSNEHDSSPYGANIENQTLKQFTVNMFADMGIQPGSIENGLILSAGSSDKAPATVTIDEVVDEISALSKVTITGTATDNDENAATADGVVALVEISFDGGDSWHVASGTTSWSYVWRPATPGNYTIQVRGIDDSLNVHNAISTQEAVTVTSAVAPNTVSIFDLGLPGINTAEPGLTRDTSAVEVGMRFSVDTAGQVTQLRYYRAPGDSDDTDVREGHLWSSDGTLLATVTFTSGVGDSGWQIADLSQPVTLAAGSEYVVSYHTSGNYVASTGFFAGANEVAFDSIDNDAFTGAYGIISAPQDGGGRGNGIFNYGSSSAFPTDTYNAANYWVDVTFAPASSSGGTNSPPVITSGNFTVAENLKSVGIVTATDADNNALTYVLGGADAALFDINASNGALSFKSAPNYEQPSDAGADNVYDLIVSVTDNRSDPITKAITITVGDVNEESGGSGGSTLFTNSDTPSDFIENARDASDYELGTRFFASEDGTIEALRYYRGAADADDTDVRTLTLWDSTGNSLGSVQITSTPGQVGWQVATLTTPIPIVAGQSYIVSYGYVPNNGDGNTETYAFSRGYFNVDHISDDGYLTAPASTAGVGNGVLSETVGQLPTLTFNASNYWVDVVYDDTNDAPGGTVTISGEAKQGAVLSAANTLTDADGLGQISYQWLRDGEPIANATGATYTLVQADVGAAITVAASYTDGGETLETVTSAATEAVANTNDAPGGTVTISGEAKQGAVLSAANTLTDADGLGQISYQWLRDGEPIANATGATYTLVQADVGAAITVAASYTDGGETLETVTSAATDAVSNVDDEATGLLAVSGTAAEGGSLTASLNNVVDADGSTTTAFQWQVLVPGSGETPGTWSDIPREDDPVLSIASDQSYVGKTVRVAATTTDQQGGTTEFFSSGQTIANVNDAPVVQNPFADQQSGENEAFSFQVPSNTFADEDGDDLEYSAVVVHDSGQPLASQPSWLVFDPITRTFSGNPPLNFVGYLNIKLIANDGSASVSDTFKLTITAASKPAVIGDPSKSSVIEDVGVVNGKLSATGTISISDENAGEAAFQTSVLSTKGNLGSLALKSDGTYTYSVSNKATQELGDGMTKVDTFTIKSLDGTAKVISFTVIGANEVLTGTARDDKISGSNAHETINGLGGNDTLIGSAGNDKLYGGEGSDNLNGGPGADLLFGEAGRDTFIFTSVGDVGYGSSRDVIGDFASGFDTIDLRSIDANSKIGKDQAFIFVAQQSTSAVANSITWHQADGVTIVQGDVNGDAIADFQIQLAGVQSLSASNFVL